MRNYNTMSTNNTTTETDQTDTLLRKGGIQQRMNCTGSVAHNIENAFVTVEKLLEAVESDTPLTDVSGIGPKTAEVIEEWYENKEQREANANASSVKRTSNSSFSITFHQSWETSLGIEGTDNDN